MDVLVVLPLHPASIERMGVAVAERVAMIDVHRERLDPSLIDEVGDRADEPLPLVFLFVAAARREQNHRRPPMAVDDDVHVAAEAVRMPAVRLASHAASY